MKIVYFIKGVIFHLLFVICTAVITISFSPFLFFKRHVLRLASLIWCKTTMLLLRFICGIKYEIIGRENLPNYPYIVASKHQSAFETILFWDLFYVPTFILKKELLKIPLFGSYLLHTGMIAIDRSAGTSALKKIISEADKQIKDKRKIIIYPEGTRTAPGSTRPLRKLAPGDEMQGEAERRTEAYSTLREDSSTASTQQGAPEVEFPEGSTEPRYSSGVAALYKHCNIPIVPVALNSGVYWPSSKWSKYPGIIKVNILPPINPGLDKEAFMSKLIHDVEETSLALYRGAE